jgi:hypothetical protein
LVTEGLFFSPRRNEGTKIDLFAPSFLRGESIASQSVAPSSADAAAKSLRARASSSSFAVAAGAGAGAGAIAVVGVGKGDGAGARLATAGARGGAGLDTGARANPAMTVSAVGAAVVTTSGATSNVGAGVIAGTDADGSAAIATGTIGRVWAP